MKTARPPVEVIWHDVECGGYAADLASWRRLAAEGAGPVVELGCGTGRVALDLARSGHAVSAIDLSPGLIAELRRRAGAAGLGVDARVGRAQSLELEESFALIIAPMQLAHLLDRAERAGMLRGAREHLRSGGRVALALLAADALASGDGAPPLPDVREIEGWVYSSLPLEVRAAGGAIEVRRLRQIVSPAGELSESIDATRLWHLGMPELEREAAAAGLRLVETLPIPPTPDHVGSEIAILEAE